MFINKTQCKSCSRVLINESVMPRLGGDDDNFSWHIVLTIVSQFAIKLHCFIAMLVMKNPAVHVLLNKTTSCWHGSLNIVHRAAFPPHTCTEIVASTFSMQNNAFEILFLLTV